MNHALFTAFIHSDQGSIRQAVKIFADHTNALTRRRRLDAGIAAGLNAAPRAGLNAEAPR